LIHCPPDSFIIYFYLLFNFLEILPDEQTKQTRFCKKFNPCGYGILYCSEARARQGYVAPSDKLMIAGIGAGGKGGDDITEHSRSPNAEIAFLCDVDDRQSAEVRKKFPKAKYYKDWRKL
jgi:hypothetical protein